MTESEGLEDSCREKSIFQRDMHLMIFFLAMQKDAMQVGVDECKAE